MVHDITVLFIRCFIFKEKFTCFVCSVHFIVWWHYFWLVEKLLAAKIFYDTRVLRIHIIVNSDNYTIVTTVIITSEFTEATLTLGQTRSSEPAALEIMRGANVSSPWHYYDGHHQPLCQRSLHSPRRTVSLSSPSSLSFICFLRTQHLLYSLIICTTDPPGFLEK